MGNGQKMKCKLKGSVKMKLQNRHTEKLTEVLYERIAMTKTKNGVRSWA